MQIRKAQKDDYAAICSLINNELGYPDVNVNDLTPRLDMMSKDINYDILVAAIDDKVVGFIGTLRELAFTSNSGYMQILAFAVSGDFQKKGIGCALLEHVENSAHSKGVDAIALTSRFSRLDTHTFYERRGYTKTSYGFSKRIV